LQLAHVLTSAFVLIALGAPAQAKDLPLPDVKERTLENGLRVLVLEDHDIPNCALYVHWNVGSRNERPGITGIAHMFEHMMFMGSRKYGKRFDPVMEAAGGSNNAWTSRDQTVYTDWFPSSALPLMLDMEADRMSGMVFEPEIVDTERGVVASERRLWMEEPVEKLREQMWATAYVAHPYQWDVLGWPSDIAAWTKKDLETFFATYYAPQNALVVLVGDVTADEALALIEEKMGGIPRGPEKPEVVTVEPEQRGERRVSLEAPAGTLPELQILWHVPESAHDDTPALEVLERLLLTGENSRLHRLLVEDKELCVSVSGGLQGLQFDASVFAVDCTVRDGHFTEPVETLVYAALTDIAVEGPKKTELRNAVAKMEARFLRRMLTIDGKAELIGETDTFFGTWRNLPSRLERLREVTAADVKRVAGQYFQRRNRTVGTLDIATSKEAE